MGVSVLYCAADGERISPRDVAAGRYVEIEGRTYCMRCAAKQISSASNLPPSAVEPSSDKPPSVGRSTRPRRATTVRPRAGAGEMDITHVAEERAARRATRSRRGSESAAPAGPGGPALPWILVGVFGLISVIAVGALVFGGARTGPALASSSSSSEPSSVASSSAVDPARLALEAQLTRLEGLDRSEAERFRDRVERWLAFKQDAAAYPELVARSDARLEVARAQQQAASTRAQGQIKAKVEELLADRQFEEARAAWEAFDPQLLDAATQQIIRLELDQVKRAEQQHLADLRDSLPRGEIPTGGHVHVPFNGRDFDGWRLDPRDAFSVGEGTIEVACRSKRMATAIPDHPSPTGGHTSLASYYLTFEFMVLEGSMSVFLNRPLHPYGHGGAQFSFEGGGRTFKAERWYRLHLRVEGEQVQIWSDGTLALNSMKGIGRDHGLITFVANRGDRYRLRDMKLRVLREGTKYNPRALPEPKQALVKPLAGLTTLAGQQGKGLEHWKIKSGELLLSSNANESVWFFGGDRWIDQVIRFEVQGLSGKGLLVLARYNLEMMERGRREEGRGVGFSIPAKELSDPARWYRVKIELIGGVGQMSIEGQPVSKKTCDPNPGSVGLVLVGDGGMASARIRKLEVTTLTYE